MGAKNDVTVVSLEAAKAHLLEYAKKRVGGMAYAFVTDNNSVLTVHERWHQPCYGEMRPYGVTHPDLLPEHQRSVHKPGDLTTPFPAEGNPVLAMLCLYQNPATWSAEAKEGLELFLSDYLDPENSPWRIITKSAEILRNEKGNVVGILFNDTHVPPTALVESWMLMRSRMSAHNMTRWAMLRKTFPDEPVAALMLFWFGFNQYSPHSQFQYNWQGYYLSDFLDVKRFLNGDPIIDGPTFFERGAYNRPNLHDIFGHTDKNVGALLKAVVPGGVLTFEEKKLPEYWGYFKKALL